MSAELVPGRPTLQDTTQAFLEYADDDALLALDPKRLTRIEHHVANLLDIEAKGSAFLRDYRWTLAFRRAFLNLEQVERRLQKRGVTLGNAKQRMLRAALVADYHAWRFADEDAKERKDWPTLKVLLGQWGVTPEILANAKQQSRYHKWAKLYLLAEDKVVRKEELIRSAMRNVRDQEAIDPKDRNPGLLRAAAELIDGPKNAQVHIGNTNTVNIVMSEVEFRERLKRLTEVGQSLQGGVREGSCVEVPEPHEEEQRGADQGDAGAGETASD